MFQGWHLWLPHCVDHHHHHHHHHQGDQRQMTFPFKCVGSLSLSAEPLLRDLPDQLLSQSNTKEEGQKFAKSGKKSFISRDDIVL